MPGAPGIAGGIIGVDAVAIRIAGIGGVDQVIASRAIDNAVAGKDRTRLELHRIDTDGIVGIKIIAGIGRQKRRIARAFQQGLRCGAVGNPNRRLSVVAIGKADGTVNEINAKIAAAQIGKNQLKAVGARPGVRSDVQPGDDELA